MRKTNALLLLLVLLGAIVSGCMSSDSARTKVMVRAPGDYVFTVLCNGTEVSSGGLEVSE
ncbi:MAG TPA: hypothetical protein ENH81_03175 [Thermococcus sp.]|nr:hypothetical protein [Thermococcus sp.]